HPDPGTGRPRPDRRSPPGGGLARSGQGRIGLQCFNAGMGVAVRERQTDIGPADYVLFVP
ncbi:MAG: hypothetical protein OXC93_11085, partial [Rhodospirillaceae bacterium]|nr:hypothetical protein [Rhodospirillaceae bacterium]